jgi:putative ABC transport system substrate-binding protein
MALPLRTLAQAPPRVYRVGWVSMSDSGARAESLASLRRGLKDLGYVEGRNLEIDTRFASGSRERADQMVRELVQSKIDVIVTQGGAAWSAYRHAGTTPVVLGFSGDPVEAKFVESLARPGGPRTGMSWLALELVGKRFELLAQLIPGVTRVAVLADPGHPGEQNERRHSETAAQRLGMTLRHFPVRNARELDVAFEAIAKQPPQALVIVPDAVTLDQSATIAAFGLTQRLPTISGWGTYADSGVLLTYGPNLNESYAYLAKYVDKILKGANPAELPMELPSTVELVINARTARAIGVRLPQAILARADRVID